LLIPFAKNLAAGEGLSAMSHPVAEITITPHLVCADAAAAIDYYARAFGGKEAHRLEGPDGKSIMHACVEIGGGRVFLVDENPQWGSFSPKSLKGTPVTIHLSVPDVDELFARAIAAGGTAKMPPTDMFWGDRYETCSPIVKAS
jgi:uncharacterized glyoxalase superfamily protein PhnB